MPNTYVMTKAAAEQLIRHEAKGLPVTVFRPAIGVYLLTQNIDVENSFWLSSKYI